jgi:predicted GTPase
MPTINDRAKLLQELEFALIVLAADGKEDSADFKEIREIKHKILQTRCINAINKIPKSDAMEKMMFNFPDIQFRIIARCDKASFV